MDEELLGKSRDDSFHDLGITIAFSLGISFVELVDVAICTC